MGGCTCVVLYPCCVTHVQCLRNKLPSEGSCAENVGNVYDELMLNVLRCHLTY